MQIRLDRNACQGDCVCELICAQVFALDEDGIAFVRENGESSNLERSEQWVEVGQKYGEKVREAAEECPTNAIHVRAAP